VKNRSVKHNNDGPRELFISITAPILSPYFLIMITITRPYTNTSTISTIGLMSKNNTRTRHGIILVFANGCHSNLSQCPWLVKLTQCVCWFYLLFIFCYFLFPPLQHPTAVAEGQLMFRCWRRLTYAEFNEHLYHLAKPYRYEPCMVAGAVRCRSIGRHTAGLSVRRQWRWRNTTNISQPVVTIVVADSWM